MPLQEIRFEVLIKSIKLTLTYKLFSCYILLTHQRISHKIQKNYTSALQTPSLIKSIPSILSSWPLKLVLAARSPRSDIRSQLVLLSSSERYLNFDIKWSRTHRFVLHRPPEYQPETGLIVRQGFFVYYSLVILILTSNFGWIIDRQTEESLESDCAHVLT